VEASGSSQGITLASAITQPMGTLVLKSTCSAANDPLMPKWSDLANDVVVNEKRLVGSRYILCQHMSLQFCVSSTHPKGVRHDLSMAATARYDQAAPAASILRATGCMSRMLCHHMSPAAVY
jgi:threonine dehydrogenase-like Zn-dependent dehydrogenase